MRLKLRERNRNITSNPCKIRAPNLLYELSESGYLENSRERFFEKVSKPDSGCWEWKGSIGSNGYGTFRLPSPFRDVVGAHRVSYSLHKGPIPIGLVVRHKCDNPICVNPDHLEVGTKADNSKDMVMRGRMPIRDQAGEKNGAAKLTADDVSKIRTMINLGKRNTDIAALFGVTHSAVSSIRRGTSWNYMELK